MDTCRISLPRVYCFSNHAMVPSSMLQLMQFGRIWMQSKTLTHHLSPVHQPSLFSCLGKVIVIPGFETLSFYVYHSDAGAGNVDELKDTIVMNELHNSIVGGTLPGQSSGHISCLLELKIVFTLFVAILSGWVE